MFPGYRGMSSYPCQRNQMPSTQHYYPNWDAAPSQVKEDPAGPSFMYEPWAHNYGYPGPMQCHNCCNHAQYPAHYNFRPPYPHFAPPPAYNHCCGSYPAYPQPYPASYCPPPHYTMDLPRYEYDKSVPREVHCCGCPNHSHQVKGGNNVKIEEHEPDGELKKGKSLVPVGPNDFEYPILWIPPGYTMNKEQPRRLADNETNKKQVFPFIKKPQTKVEEHQDPPRANKPQQSMTTVEQDPNVKYGWFPLDMDSIRRLMEGGDGRKTHRQENKTADEKKTHDAEIKDQAKQFPYPIIWMPFEGQEEDRARGQGERNAGKVPTEESPATIKAAPVKSTQPDNKAEETWTAVADRGSVVGTPATEGANKLRTIPVKQLEESGPKSLKKDEENKGNVKENANKESTGNGTNGNSSSPTKKSKLPPICLRVDPPKKKNRNGSSRSPSPPGDKKRQESDGSNARGKSSDMHPSKKEMNVTEAVDTEPSRNKTEVSHGAREERKIPKIVQVKVADADRKVLQEADGAESSDAKNGDDKGVQAQEPQEAIKNSPQEGSKPVRKIFSETEAAAKIQSAYRGYEVRRWEPLKKLRQIAKVREEAAEVQRHIEAFESRARSTPIDDREKIAVGETIMKLLLKLDTIQGLHPSIRDVRRTLAKDLTILQEELDSITSQKVIRATQETAPIENVEETSNVSRSDEDSKDTVETAKEPSMGTQVEGSQGGAMSPKVAEEDEVPPNLNEVFPSQPPNQDVVCGSEDKETSETLPGKIEAIDKPENEAADMKGMDSDGSETFPGKLSTQSQESMSDVGPVEDIVLEVDMPSVNADEKAPSEVDDNLKDIAEMEDGSTVREELAKDAGTAAGNEAEEVDPAPADNDEKLNLLAELPQEVIKENTKEPTSEVPSLETLGCNEMKPSSEKPDVKGEQLLADEPGLSSEAQKTLSSDQVMEPSSEKPADLECQELLTIEPVSRKPDELSSETHDVQESASAVGTIDIDIPVVEQDMHKLQDQTGEVAAPADPSSNEPADLECEPSNCNPDELSSETRGVQQSESDTINIDIPVAEQEVHGLQEPTGEVAAPAGGLQVGEECDVPANENEAKHSPQVRNIELDSTTACLENPVGSDEDIPKLPSGDQEKTQDKNGSHYEAQQYEDKYITSKPSEEGQDSVSACGNEEQLDKQIIEENEKLRAMLEKLIASGREQQNVISSLSGKVKDLEKKLARKKTKSTKRPRVMLSRPLCGKPSKGSLRGQRPMGVAS